MKFEEVDRPANARYREESLLGQLRRTVETGRAIKIPITMTGGMRGYSNTLRKEGLSPHWHKAGEFYIAWCEKRP